MVCKPVDFIMVHLDLLTMCTTKFWLIIPYGSSFYGTLILGLWFLVMLITSWAVDLEVTFKVDFGQQKSTMEGWLFVGQSLIRSYLVIIIGLFFWFKIWHANLFKIKIHIQTYFILWKIIFWRKSHFSCETYYIYHSKGSNSL